MSVLHSLLAVAFTPGQIAGLVVAILVAGYLLLGFELFVIPGFGVVGVLGIACLVAGSGIAWTSFGATWGAATVVGSLLLAVVLVLIFAKTRAGRRLVLEQTLAGAVAVSTDEARLVGCTGVAESPLRPTGVGRFGEERIPVESEGTFVARGTPIRVIAVREGRAVVEPVPGREPSP